MRNGKSGSFPFPPSPFPFPQFPRFARDRPTNLKIFAFKDRKEATIAEDIRGYAISDDGSKLLVAQGPGYNIYDATPQGDKTRKPLH